ncbi:MAG TPA: dihydrolipoamide acetyltransferase family protein [Ilumatobacteraceae bacterium]|nr:dihydrolipoamide acetyltransferase family protein [Ilumatobacteraceae bacterium]
MSEYVVKLPDVGEGIAEAEIVDWHVNVGDTIAEDQLMVEVMTDKATVELPSPVAGVVTSLGAEIGQVLQVGSPLIRIETPDGAAAPTAPADVAAPAVEPAPPATPQPVEPSPADLERRDAPTAAPAVRARAASLGIDLAEVSGSGPQGRVSHSDLDRHLTGNGAAGRRTLAAVDDSVDAVPVIGLRRNIAQRMQAAKDHIPHFTYVDEVDVTELERLRAELNERHGDARPRLTVLPFLMRAVVVAVRDFPQINARYDDENGVVNRHRSMHIGVATQTSKGLMVAVVKSAESRDLWDTAAEVARLSTAARDNTIALEELTGSTITITSLGALGGIVSTPIINYPEVAIIGVNKIATRPVWVDGAFLPRQVMNLSSSFDHRVVDGADAAAFIQRLRGLLESPALLFVD